jgi:hypothetical protein
MQGHSPEVTDIWDVSELFLEWVLLPEMELSDLASVSMSLLRTEFIPFTNSSMLIT